MIDWTHLLFFGHKSSTGAKKSILTHVRCFVWYGYWVVSNIVPGVRFLTSNGTGRVLKAILIVQRQSHRAGILRCQKGAGRFSIKRITDALSGTGKFLYGHLCVKLKMKRMYNSSALKIAWVKYINISDHKIGVLAMLTIYYFFKKIVCWAAIWCYLSILKTWYQRFLSENI